MCKNHLSWKCSYTGEADQEGKLCGHGIAFSVDNPNVRYEGTFRDDKFFGISKSHIMKN